MIKQKACWKRSCSLSLQFFNDANEDGPLLHLLQHFPSSYMCAPVLRWRFHTERRLHIRWTEGGSRRPLWERRTFTRSFAEAVALAATFGLIFLWAFPSDDSPRDVGHTRLPQDCTSIKVKKTIACPYQLKRHSWALMAIRRIRNQRYLMTRSNISFAHKRRWCGLQAKLLQARGRGSSWRDRGRNDVSHAFRFSSKV